MVRPVRELGRHHWRKELLARLGPAVVWLVVLVLVAVLIYWIDQSLDNPIEEMPGLLEILLEPTGGLQTIVAVVPAIVIAIFVFAAGTLFVVAQVVPPARGTRAVEVLRDRHLAWTISPALALTPLTVFVLVLEPKYAWPLALALLLGAVAYLLVSTGVLLSILGEATNPTQFAGVLAKKHGDAIAVLNPDEELGPDRRKWWRSVQDMWRKVRIERKRRSVRLRQDAVDELYDVVRTLRGWTRTSATAGDSRELQVSLQATLDLVHAYARVPVGVRNEVPSEYIRTAESPETSPVVPEQDVTRGVDRNLKCWAFWVPPLYPPKPTNEQSADPTAESENQAANEAKRTAENHPRVMRKMLPKIWVANEIGRSLVRAVEFATISKALLDRDRSRLLLSLEKAVRRFAGEPDSPTPDVSAGVLVAYLIELGLGVRRCPQDEVEWHYEPLIRLAVLHRDYSATENADKNLVIGTAAGVLKVAEAITAARIREQEDRWPPSQNSQEEILEQTVQNLHNVEELSRGGETFALFKAGDTPVRVKGQEMSGSRLALDLAGSLLLEPREPSVIHPTDTILLEKLQETLKRSSGNSDDQTKRGTSGRSGDGGAASA